MKKPITCLILFLLISVSQSANILFYFAIGTYSHTLSVWPLVEELAARGHQVTFLSPYPYKPPNPKVIQFAPEALLQRLAGEENTLLERRRNGTKHIIWDELDEAGIEVCSILLSSPEIQKWLKTAKFDLVVIDGLFNECGVGMAYKFGAKVIIFSTTSVFIWLPDMMGIVSESSWVPDMQHHYEEPMSFLTRVYNTLRPLYWHFWTRQVNYFPEMDKLLRTGLNIPDMPSIKDLEMKTDLIFYSSHYSMEYARSLPPVFVSIGGLHIVESGKALPKDIAKFIDESGSGGVVYVSFGTYAKASMLPDETKAILYEVFGSFKSTRFIWKFDEERPKDLPENVMFVKWAPQQEILAHEKTKGFISHCGLLSLQEAIYHAVPLIVFPIFAEQDFWANLVHKSGYGIKLEIVDLKKSDMEDALNKLLTNDRYKSTIQKVSKLFKDRPKKPLESAIWWTEYILRQENTSSLKPLSLYQIWYERRVLDVWIFLFLTVSVLASTISYLIYKLVFKLMRSRESAGPNKFKRA